MPSFRPMFVGDDSGGWMLTRAHLGELLDVRWGRRVRAIQ